MKCQLIAWVVVAGVGFLSSSPGMADEATIHQAAASGDRVTVKQLLQGNAQLAMQLNRLNDLPVREAILNGHTGIARLLIAHMRDVDAQNPRGMTPLHYAAHAGNRPVVKLLLAKGATIDQRNIDGRSALHFAARQGKHKTVRLLIKRGATVNLVANNGATPLRMAIENQQLKTINCLTAHNARLDVVDQEDGQTLIHSLAALGVEKLVQQLIAKGVDTRSKDRAGRTLLHNAAVGGLAGLMRRLIKQGEAVDSTDIYGSTPLHEAAYHGQLKTAALLVAKGADLQARRPDGTTPLHLAQARGHRRMVKWLKNKGAQHTPPVLPVLTGDYLGQPLPGERGVLFAPGLISKGESSDSLQGWFDRGNTLVLFKWSADLKTHWTQWPPFLMKRKAGQWQAIYQSKRVGDPWFYNVESFAVGERMIFPWTRQLDGSGPSGELYLWSTIRTKTGWAEPKRFAPPINLGFDTWPSVSDDKTLYFHSVRPGGEGRTDIYRSKPVNGDYRTVENAGPSINSEAIEHDPLIARDVSYLLFSSYRPGGLGEDDIYVAFRKKDGSWTKAKNLGERVNSKYAENRAVMSPDGKYLFYTSTRTGNLDVYWVSTVVIEELRPTK